MGKIVMPKNSALLEEVEAVLKIYYEAGCWISNDEYKRQLKAMIGDDQYASSYTKKAQITSYFGFTEWEDITNARSMRRITERGKNFYENLRQKNESGIFEDLMQSLEKTTFGRNNFGCPDSNSDVEPPVLFVRAIMDLGYLTYKEFAFLLWKLEDCGGNYTDVKAEIKAARSQMTFDIPEAATKYTDAKPIMVLVRWGFLAEDTNAVGAKHIVINSKVRERYQVRLQNLKIYNIDKNIDDSEKQNKRENQNGDDVLMVENSAQKKDYTINELGAILAEMYNKATSKTAAIHIFGIKYGEVIKKLGYSATALVAAAKLNDAYHAEVSKGLRIYEAFYANEYGIKFYDGECTEPQATHTLPVCSPRERKTYPLNCILYGAPGTGKTYATAAYALAVAENKELKEVERESRDLIMQRYNQLVENGRVTFTTFHQSYGYEDFIQGMRPDTAGAGNGLSFKTVDGVFKRIADRAFRDPTNDYVIIIDEINRANISKVFGELITLIEDDKRWGELNAVSVTLPSGDTFAVPNNLYIVGTMNSADKSISLIDTALRRRFVFVEHKPKLELIQDDLLRKVLEVLNKGISEELRSTDLLIGHSYFLNKTVSDLVDIMNRSIIPLLYEYFFDDRKKVLAHVNKAIEGLDLEVDANPFGRVSVKKKGAE